MEKDQVPLEVSIIVYVKKSDLIDNDGKSLWIITVRLHPSPLLTVSL